MAILTDLLILFGAIALFYGLHSFDRFSRRLERVVGDLEKRDQQQEREDNITFFELPAPEEYGWDNIYITPAKRRSKRIYCFGGPPTYIEILEYDLRPQDRPRAVFARLVDMWKEGWPGDSYQVINGTICARADERVPSDNLEKLIVWHELLGSERYAILAAHGTNKEFFVKEQERIQKALQSLNARAEALGAIQIETLLLNLA